MPKRIATMLATALLGASLAVAGPVAADPPGNTVLDWNQYAVEALMNPPTAPTPGAGQSPTIGSIHLSMVEIAVFDAVNAIAGGYEPYLAGLDAADGASQDAAAAQAAHDVLVGLGVVGNAPPLTDAIVLRLDGYLTDSLGDVADGAAKDAGIAIGAAAADAILADRSDDGRGGSFRFTVGTEIGEWRPTAANGLNDPFAWIKDVRPFTLRSGSQYITEGPLDLTSAQYATEYNEVKDLGSLASTARSTDQTATALYFTENPFSLYNRSWRALIGPDGHDLSLAKSARFLAMTNVAGADALIDCWNNKALWSNWRPVTAINSTADDGNAGTEPEVGWTPLIANPPYPDDPSGYNCATAGHMYAARAFFGTDKVSFDLINAANVHRPYDRFSDVPVDTVDARIWLGIHFRFADAQGAWLGKKVGQWVGHRFFEPVG